MIITLQSSVFYIPNFSTDFITAQYLCFSFHFYPGMLDLIFLQRFEAIKCPISWLQTQIVKLNLLFIKLI